jgi:DNA-binding HxlR family transcriptional regulator
VAKRSYDRPDCGLAVALDLLGERWTLLIVRELMLGPQRYTDLSEGLAGLSTNLLAGRLRHLEDVGVICRSELPPPAACTVYELTEVGAELEPLVIQLARWGSQFADCSSTSDPRAAAFALMARQGATAATVQSGDCHIEIGEFSITVRIDAGRLQARPHAPSAPAAAVRLSTEVYGSLMDGEVTWADAASGPRVEVTGDISHLDTVFGTLDHS